MNLESLAQVGEALGGLAILVSLLYVAIELRRNTTTTRANTSYKGAHSWAELNTTMAENSRLASLTARSMPESDPQFSAEEARQVHFLGRSCMERLDGLYYLYRNKQHEAELWEVRVTWARRFLALTYWGRWWQQERQTSNYSLSFISELEKEPGDGGPI